MKKNLIITTLFLCLSLILICTYCFATTNIINDTVNGARGAIGSVENGVGNLANDISSGMNSATNSMENTFNYNSMQTSTDMLYGNNGLSDSMWTWIILAIAAIIIITLVWSYSKQFDNNRYNK